MQQVATGYGLIEGPVWDPARGLYFSDVINGGVFLLDRAGRVAQVVPKRRGIGGMALHDKGGLVVGGRDISWAAADGGKTLPALDAIPAPASTIHRRPRRPHLCRLAAFAVPPARPGHPHVIDLDGTMRTVSDGVLLTAARLPPDGKLLYHSDARHRWCEYDEARGFGRPAEIRLTGEPAPDGPKVRRRPRVADARRLRCS
jgi:gluconolactonase